MRISDLSSGVCSSDLGALLALDVLEVEAARLDLLEGRPRRCQHLTALEVVDEGDEAARRQDLKAFGPGRLAALGGRADEAALLAQGMDRRRQHAGEIGRAHV